MKTGDKVVVMYAIIPEEQYGKLSMPPGSFAKAFQIGPIEQLVQQQECKHWGMIMAVSLQRLARKLCPEIAESKLIHLNSGPQ